MSEQHDDNTIRFVVAHGMHPHTAEELNRSLKAVIDAMPGSLYGNPRHELTQAEQDVLREGGVDLDAVSDRDPVAETAVRFAALVETSLTTAQAADQLGVPESHVRQMIARRAVYSILLDHRRYIPTFQFEPDGSLVTNIAKVNGALPEDLHPLDVAEWYTQPDPDLFLGDDVDSTMSPIEWLRTGGNLKRVIDVARSL
jgi:hypothetical protein